MSTTFCGKIHIAWGAGATKLFIVFESGYRVPGKTGSVQGIHTPIQIQNILAAINCPSQAVRSLGHPEALPHSTPYEGCPSAWPALRASTQTSSFDRLLTRISDHFIPMRHRFSPMPDHSLQHGILSSRPGIGPSMFHPT